MRYYSDLETLEIDFQKSEFDWIEFQLKLGPKNLMTRFWAYRDPLPDLRRWLEAICIGVEQCAFQFDTEGSDQMFVFRKRWGDEAYFEVKYPYENCPKILLGGMIDRRQLVEAFYKGFLGYGHSFLFNKAAWEAEYRWERIEKALGITREELPTTLLKLRREPLERLLNLTDSDGKPSSHLFPNELNDGTSNHWITEEGYDSLDDCEKLKIIQLRLGDIVNNCNGSKISNLRSQIIDDFLRSNCRTEAEVTATQGTEQSDDWPTIILDFSE